MIAVCPNPYRDNDLVLTRRCISLLADAGYPAVVCPVFADPGDEVLPPDLDVQKLRDVDQPITLAIVIGGDGTVLNVVRDLNSRAIPLLGVNLGTMGFMTSLEPEDIGLIVNRGEEVVFEGSALNDAYIHGYGDSIILHAMCDGQTITSFSGDGIIFSTPTGSTGYSLSAGGPVVEPETENIIVTPICAHTMVSRSFVLGPERVASVTATRLHDTRAYLSVDGYVSADIRKDDLLTVRKSEKKVLFADLGAKSFYENTYEKLT